LRSAHCVFAGEAGAAGSIILEDGLLKRFDALVTPKNLTELSQIRKKLFSRLPLAIAVRVFYAARPFSRSASRSLRRFSIAFLAVSSRCGRRLDHHLAMLIGYLSLLLVERKSNIAAERRLVSDCSTCC